MSVGIYQMQVSNLQELIVSAGKGFYQSNLSKKAENRKTFYHEHREDFSWTNFEIRVNKMGVIRQFQKKGKESFIWGLKRKDKTRKSVTAADCPAAAEQTRLSVIPR